MKIRHNHRSQYWITAIVIVVCSFVFVGLLSDQSMAQQKEDVLKGLTVSPLRRDFELSPGTTKVGMLTVTNSTDKPMTVNMSAQKFGIKNQQYDYTFDPESDIAKWISFNPSQAVIEPGKDTKISYTIGVPVTAGLGGAYISLFASTGVGTLDNSANSQQRVASLLYITVESDVLGAATRTGQLLSLSSPWFVNGKSNWGMTIRNGGTTHFHSKYNVNVVNLFGQLATTSQGGALILPGTVRVISDVLPLPSIPGVYKIVYTIGMGDKPTANVTRYILFMPPWATLTAVALIIVAVFGFRLIISKKR